MNEERSKKSKVSDNESIRLRDAGSGFFAKARLTNSVQPWPEHLGVCEDREVVDRISHEPASQVSSKGMSSETGVDMT